MPFIGYEKVERWDHTSEVDGILKGTVYIEEKLDGANSSVWFENDIKTVFVGKRSCQIATKHLKEAYWSIGDAFRGLPEHIFKHPGYDVLFEAHPTWHLFCEWLVKHTVIYNPGCINIAYVFDIIDELTGQFILPEEWMPVLLDCHIAYVPILEKLESHSFDKLKELLQHKSSFRNGTMEGIVIKNYNFINKWGRLVFMKVVGKEFYETHKVVWGVGDKTAPVENRIAQTYVTEARVRKAIEKIKDERQGGEVIIQDIPQVLGRVYYDVITEDAWDIVGKKFKGVTINFNALRQQCTHLTKIFFFRYLEEMGYRNAEVVNDYHQKGVN